MFVLRFPGINNAGFSVPEYRNIQVSIFNITANSTLSSPPGVVQNIG